MQVKDIMAKDVIGVGMDTHLSAIQELFRTRGFHHVLVVQGRKVLGVISDRDVLRHLSPYLGTLAEQKRDVDTLEQLAHQVMSRRPITIAPDADIATAAKLLLDHGISCLPVVDAEGHLQGLLTARDLVRSLVPQSV